MNPDEELADLFLALGSRNPRDRRRAAIRLSQVDDPAAAPELVRLLLDDEPAVRAAAVTSLGRVRSAECLEALERFLCESRPDSPVAVDALLNWGREATPALLRALELGTTPVRIAAAQGLGRIADPAAVPALVEALRDPTGLLVDAALHALIRISAPEALAALADGLDGCTRSTRLDVIEILRKRRDQRAIPALCRQLDDPDEAIARRAGLALLEISVPAAEVREMLEPLFALRGARYRADPRAAPALLLALEHGKPRVQIGAARWLGYLAQHAPAPELRRAVPLLKRRLGIFAPTPEADRQVFAAALKKIEAALEAVEDRPIPADAPGVDTRGLPIPGDP